MGLIAAVGINHGGCLFSIVMLSVVMLSVVVLSVAAPQNVASVSSNVVEFDPSGGPANCVKFHNAGKKTTSLE